MKFSDIFSREVRKTWGGWSSLTQWRHYFAWKKALSPKSSTIKSRCPWITFDAIEMLNRHLAKDSVVFEFGAGGSTLFFLDRAGKVLSVEHDRQWLDAVGRNLTVEEKNRWTPILAEPEFEPLIGGKTDIYSDPKLYRSRNPSYADFQFRKYAEVIDGINDESLDVLLIDGRVRPSCIRHGLGKVKKNGLLVVDNGEREYYLTRTISAIRKKYVCLLNAYGATSHNEGFTKTIIWKKR